MQKPVINSAAVAIDVAKRLLASTSGDALRPSEIGVTRFDRGKLEERRLEIQQVFDEMGVNSDSELQEVLASASYTREHWAVAFFPIGASGSARTVHATIVLVFDDTGEACISDS